MRNALRDVAASALDLVRRGPRRVLWTDFHQGVGNFLYLWLWADTHTRPGAPCLVLGSPAMDLWFEEFPAVRPLVVKRGDVRLTDRREVLSPQGFGMQFGADDLERFVRARILHGRSIEAALARLVDPDRVVINIRRGDYYSDLRFRGSYGIDLVAYVREAMAATMAQGTPSAIHVVSDGPDWCRERLGWLADYAPLTFAEPNAAANLATIATARRLVLTNSTFSYWGGYISNVIHGNHADVVAPWFHSRAIHHGRAYQLDPRWTIVRDIPGGWDS